MKINLFCRILLLTAGSYLLKRSVKDFRIFWKTICTIPKYSQSWVSQRNAPCPGPYSLDLYCYSKSTSNVRWIFYYN